MQTTSIDVSSNATSCPTGTDVGASIQAALASLDIDAVTEAFRANNEFLFLQRFLDAGWIRTTLAQKANDLLPIAHRGKVGSYKKSGSVGYFTLQEQAPEFVELYRSRALIAFVSNLVGAPLVLSPDDDPHACALYYYTEPGDHVGFHYDKSWYRGARYTVLLGLVQDSTHCLLECHLHKDDPARPSQNLKVETTAGSMVVFNGDKLWHGVSPLAEGEQRILLTLEYLTDPHMAAHKRLISNFKDAVAYFGFRGIKRKR